MVSQSAQTKTRVLIVDDALDIRESLAQYLSNQGLAPSTAANSTKARKMLAQDRFDIVILDIMMPGEDGLSLCRWISSTSKLPVILLTAMAADTDRIIGLEIGADDYVVKPFNPRELLARIRSILRRCPAGSTRIELRARRFGDWVHNPIDQTVTKGTSQPIKLTSAENRLITVFLDNPNTVLSRGMLLERVMQREEKPYDRAVDNQIGRLRKKLETDPSRPTLLLTEWGGGYKFMANVVDVTEP